MNNNQELLEKVAELENQLQKLKSMVKVNVSPSIIRRREFEDLLTKYFCEATHIHVEMALSEQIKPRIFEEYIAYHIRSSIDESFYGVRSDKRWEFVDCFHNELNDRMGGLHWTDSQYCEHFDLSDVCLGFDDNPEQTNKITKKIEHWTKDGVDMTHDQVNEVLYAYILLYSEYFDESAD
jgi:hypothetical protein